MPDIDALEGSDLDAAVAEHVMGWHRTLVDPDGVMNAWWFTRDSRKMQWVSAFGPSSDFASTMLVLYEAVDDGFVVSVGPAKSAGYWAEVGKASWAGACYEKGSTLPVAICRALVKAYKEDHDA